MPSEGSQIAALSSDDVLELTKFSEKKSHIDEQIRLIEESPDIDVFRPLRPYKADIELLQDADADIRHVSQRLSQWKTERSQLEADVERFNIKDMSRLRTVAKAASKGHLSAADTDLIELTLETIYALDKLVRLLSRRKSSLDLATLSLDWERSLHACWTEYSTVKDEIDHFVTKRARWVPSDNEPKLVASTSASHMDQVVRPDDHGSRTIPVDQGDQRSSRSLASRQMAAEIIELEASRINLRVRALVHESVPKTGGLLDSVIDQCQVPDQLLDEQEKLEDAASELLASGDFVLQLSEQWKGVDKVVQTSRSVRAQAKVLEAEIAEAFNHSPVEGIEMPLSDKLGTIERQILALVAVDAGDRARVRTPTSVCLKPGVMPPDPAHIDYPDQPECNELIRQTVQKEAQAAVKRMWLARTSFSRFAAALHDFRTAKDRIAEVSDGCIALERLVGQSNLLVSVDMASALQAYEEELAGSPLRHASPDDMAQETAKRLDSSMQEAAESLEQLRAEASRHLKSGERRGLKEASNWLEATSILTDLDKALDRSTNARRDMQSRFAAEKRGFQLISRLRDKRQALEQWETALVESCTQLVGAMAHQPPEEEIEETQYKLAGLFNLASLDDLAATASFIEEFDRAQTHETTVKLFQSRLKAIAELEASAHFGSRWEERLRDQFHDMNKVQERFRTVINRISKVQAHLDGRPGRLADDQRAAQILAEIEELDQEAKAFDALCREQVRMVGPPSQRAEHVGCPDEIVKARLNDMWLQLTKLLHDTHSSAAGMDWFVVDHCSTEGSPEIYHDRESFSDNASEASLGRPRSRSSLPRTPVKMDRKAFPSRLPTTVGTTKRAVSDSRASLTRAPFDELRRHPAKDRTMTPVELKPNCAASQPTTPRKRSIQRFPNHYKANPKSRLDVAIGRIVNKLPVPVKISQASLATSATSQEDYKDESGRYWVGEPEPKLCFCRILRSRTVMVRVGGGWQELSRFVLQHYSHLSSVSITPTSSPKAGQGLHSPTGSPWIRPASGSAHPSIVRQQAQPTRHTSLGLGASPVGRFRHRVESLPSGAALASASQAFRAPSSLRQAVSVLETPLRKALDSTVDGLGMITSTSMIIRADSESDDDSKLLECSA